MAGSTLGYFIQTVGSADTVIRDKNGTLVVSIAFRVGYAKIDAIAALFN